MHEKMSKKWIQPIVVVLGSTATGKSKLGMELAKRFNGEIISADSMQVYEGLDIITNKVTAEEMRTVPHHLINVVRPPEEFSVTQFRRRSLSIIEDMMRRNKLPIIVGGTNYYVESLLWNFAGIEDNEGGDDSLEEKEPVDCVTIDSKNLFEELRSVDPERASQLHPHNLRKIARSLQVFQHTGRKHSDILQAQKKEEGSSHLGGPLRFQNSLVFWLSCDQEVLNQRIISRVDKMIGRGVVEEIDQFYSKYKHNKSYEESIFQAIGFKEFRDFLQYDGPNTDLKSEYFKNGVDALNRVTIKYSKKQKTWVKNRFLTRPRDMSPNIYKLDVTDLSCWKENVLDPALLTCDCLLNNKTIPVLPLERIDARTNQSVKHVCEICNDRVLIGDDSWHAHLKSRPHRRKIKSLEKQKQFQIYKDNLKDNN